MVFDSSVSSKRELSVLNPVEQSHQPRALLLTHAVILSHYDADAVTAPHGARHRLSVLLAWHADLGQTHPKYGKTSLVPKQSF